MNLLFALIVASAVASALIGGVFFAFSAFVLRALATMPPAQGIRAMQRINITVINPLFLGVFIGTAPLLALTAYFARHSTESFHWLLAAFVIYLLGAIGVTMVFNVSHNNRLAALEADSPDAAVYWPTYMREWLIWNHVRCVASLVAAAATMFAVDF